MAIIAISGNALSKSQHALIYHLEGAKGFCFKGSVPLDLRKASSHAVRRFRCVLNRTDNHHNSTSPRKSSACLDIKNTLQMLDLDGLGAILVVEFCYAFAPFGAGTGKKILRIRVRNTSANTHTHTPHTPFFYYSNVVWRKLQSNCGHFIIV